MDRQHKEESWTGRLDCFVDHWGYTFVRRQTKFDRIDYNWLTVTTAILNTTGVCLGFWKSYMSCSIPLGAVSIVES